MWPYLLDIRDEDVIERVGRYEDEDMDVLVVGAAVFVQGKTALDFDAQAH